MTRWALILLMIAPLCGQRIDRMSVLKEFAELLSLPNVARNRADMERNADKIIGMYALRGVSLRRLDGAGGPPALFGEIRVPGAKRTILLYAHYDGQPVVPAQWRNGAPFEPVLLDEKGAKLPWPTAEGLLGDEWRLQARSASDDKAPIIAFLAALDSGVKPKANVKFIFDGEEEAGSPHLRGILERNKGLLRADGMIFCDGPVHQTRRQLIAFGARGNATVGLTVYGPRRELHSGHYGNFAPNPAMMMAHLLASMKDEDGRVRIAGFYDDVVPLNEAEKKALAEVPPVEEDLKREFGLAASESPGKRLDEVLALPALNIQGLFSGGTGAEARNVVPAIATASLGIRLVKGMVPRKTADQVAEHVRKQGYFVVRDREPTDAERLAHPRICQVRSSRDGTRAVRVPLDAPFAADVVMAVESARGKVVKLPTMGGTLPIDVFEDVLGVPVIVVPVANHDNNQHSHNENIRLKNLWDGIVTLGALLAME
ncbi:MAG TPA: M20/M25/M40 family metallo-hydrolase [Bryobacteraceae bacterium]|nr:M20/M25/M40 family metallo-hydrolase [Bryobacteraceae bacterium]